MPNKLIHESSPYLLQHANNPVEWYPWGEEALNKAKAENKPIIISIGYAACHWCHVMEHESFEDEEVAQVMNEHYICIKVDREERPDVDKVYMDAVQLMTGRGGWPLNAIALPDGRPIYGGTYFKKPDWINVLTQVANVHTNEPERALQTAEQMLHHMQNGGGVTRNTETVSFSEFDIQRMLVGWLEQIDTEWGGRKVNANKFPLPMNNLALIRTAFFTGDDDVQEAVDVSLEKMAYGGIYDHLGGGFSRYSVDAYWKVPHFEKMLYDNGQLVSVYAEAFQQMQRPLYKHVVYETLDFVARELTSPDGGFYSSLDADSEGVEGKFYVWTYEEVEALLGKEDAQLFSGYYNVHPQGNWEETNVLFMLEEEEEFAARWKVDLNTLRQSLNRSKRILFEAREKRIRPGLDDKILTSWNALMLKGYIDAYRVFGAEKFLQTALTNAHFLKDKMTDGAKLYRNYKNGQRSITAFLEDYAFVIDAYIALYQVTFDEQWLKQAEIHIEYVQQHFYDKKTGMYFYSSDEGEQLVKRSMEIQDDVIPSSNAALAHSFYTLALLLHKDDYRQQYEQMLANVKASIMEHPMWYALWAQLALKHAFPHIEVAITGEKALEYRLAIEKAYFPQRIFAGATTHSDLPILHGRFTDQTTLYICEGNTCQLPVSTVVEAWQQMGIVK